MKVTGVAFLALFMLISGCSATVKTGDSSDLALPAETRNNVVVSFQGNEKVRANPDWQRVKSSWRSALQSEAAAAGVKLSERKWGEAASKQPGLAVAIYVTNFRYLTSSERYGLGVMVGNAWVNSSVTYSDVETGAPFGTRTYDTSSSAWEGVLSAMTDEQLQAISKAMIRDIKGASVIARPLPSPHPAELPSGLSKEQQLEQLKQQALPYEEYQKRYRAIMGE